MKENNENTSLNTSADKNEMKMQLEIGIPIEMRVKTQIIQRQY